MRLRWLLPLYAAFVCSSLPAPSRAADVDESKPPHRDSPAADQPAPADPATTSQSDHAPTSEDNVTPQERPESDEPEPTVDELMTELLVGDSEEGDLSWLYSEEIYEPSDLGGRAVPSPALPSRGDGTLRPWNPRWKRFSAVNYIISGTAIALGFTGALIQPRAAAWRDRISIDERVHSALGIHDYNQGVWARDTSDLLLSVSVAFPLLVDSLVITHWYRDSGDTAKQMALISTETLSVMMGVQAMTAGLASRERPYVRHCGDGLDENLGDCEGHNPFRSFFSGHTSLSFAGAGLTCSHHIHHDVFGDDLADGLACGIAMLTAGTVGTMRIVGDQHYLTDVVVGAGIGTLIGMGIPWLLHYSPSSRSSSSQSISWQLMPTPHGVGVGGKF